MDLLQKLHSLFSDISNIDYDSTYINPATYGGINQVLLPLYEQNIHILDLDFYISKNPALKDEFHKAVFCIWKISQFIQNDNGELIKPVVILWKIQNTKLSEDTWNWQNIVILPKNHKLINGNSLENFSEKIIFCASSEYDEKLQIILNYLLLKKIETEEGNSFGGFFPNADRDNVKIIGNSGLWCIFSIVMLISNGNSNFIKEIKYDDLNIEFKIEAALKVCKIDLCKNQNYFDNASGLGFKWIFDLNRSIYENLIKELEDWENLAMDVEIDFRSFNIIDLCSFYEFKIKNSSVNASQLIQSCRNEGQKYLFEPPQKMKKINVEPPPVNQSALKIKSEYQSKFKYTSKSLKAIIDNGGIFIDKTLFIKKILDCGSSAILITRPRRWGKSFNMSMLKDFLHPEKNADGSLKNLYLFTGGKDNVDLTNLDKSKCLKIMTVDNEKYKNIIGTIPTIFLTFSEIPDQTIDYESSYEYYKAQIKQKMLDAYNLYEDEYFQYLERAIRGHFSNVLNQEFLLKNYTGQDLESIVRNENIELPDSLIQFSRFTKNPSNIDLSMALPNLIEMLFEFYQKRVIVLIDEYDGPINKAPDKDKNDILKLMLSILHPIVKDMDNDIKKIVITGIYDLERADMMNNLKVYTIQNSLFSECFGFTESEVNELLMKTLSYESEADLREQKELIKEWYNGYNVGKYTIYNPWSIINCLDAAANNDAKPLQPYWINTGGIDSLISVLNEIEYFADLFELINKKRIILKNPIDQRLNVNFENKAQSYGSKINSFWTILLHAGYLTQGKIDKSTVNFYTYIIPNKEVKIDFYRSVLRTWMKNRTVEKAIGIRHANIIDYFEDCDEFKSHFQKEVLDIYADEGENTEAYFQNLLGTMLKTDMIQMEIPKYRIRHEISNTYRKTLNSIFYPAKGQGTTVIIHEYKTLDSANLKKIKEKADDALWQIYAKKCMESALDLYNMSQYKHFEKIFVRGIVFYKPTAGEFWNIFIKEHKINIDDAKRINDNIFSTESKEMLENWSILSGESSSRKEILDARKILCGSYRCLDNLIEVNTKNLKRKHSPRNSENGHQEKRKKSTVKDNNF